MGRKNKKNQRQSNSRSLKDGKKEKEANENLLQSPTIETRETNNLDFFKTILIVCEGETEAAYFNALKDVLSHRIALKIEVLPERPENAYSSLAKLIDVALGKLEKNTYYEVWIITDNDEENAYKLDDPSITKIEQYSIAWAEVLRLNQIRNMSVRSDEAERSRIQYFLHSAEYEAFLQNLFPLLFAAQIASIVSLTTKRNSFEEIEKGIVNFFEQYQDKKLDKKEAKHLSNIKIAYSAISFEHWLLLHFEYNQTAFYNSREYLHYFDSKKYFGETISGSFVNRFEKGYYLYENKKRLKPFFEDCESKAVSFALHLHKNHAVPKLTTGLKYFEINPYCDVHHLIGSFMNTQFLEAGQLYAEISTDMAGKKAVLLKNLQLQITENNLDISFYLALNESIMSRNITASLSFDIYQTTGLNRQLTPNNIQFNNQIYRIDDNVFLRVELPILHANEFCLLSFDLEKLYPQKGKKLVFYI
jgi:hypothetical protein